MNHPTKVLGMAFAGSLLAASLLSPSALAAKKCGAYKPAEPQSDSEQTAEALDAKTVTVTEKYTEAKPLVIDYTHGPAFWFLNDPVDAEGQRPAVEDTAFFNIQVDTKAKYAGVSIRQQWAEDPKSDMDLYLFDKRGAQIGMSADWNMVQGTPLNTGTGGPGFEQVVGLGVSDCTGITIESRAFWTAGESMQLIIWVGDTL